MDNGNADRVVTEDDHQISLLVAFLKPQNQQILHWDISTKK